MSHVVTIGDYANGGAPNNTGSFKDRSCPNMTVWWHFSWDAFSLAKAPESAALLRRLVMWGTLLARLALRFFILVLYIKQGNLIMIVVEPLLIILGFFFVGFCLAQIGEAMGTRKVLGMSVGRWHFDIFLAAVAAVQCTLLFTYIFVAVISVHNTIWSLDLLVWLLIVLFGWFASWQPEEGAILP